MYCCNSIEVDFSTAVQYFLGSARACILSAYIHIRIRMHMRMTHVVRTVRTNFDYGFNLYQ